MSLEKEQKFPKNTYLNSSKNDNILINHLLCPPCHLVSQMLPVIYTSCCYEAAAGEVGPRTLGIILISLIASISVISVLMKVDLV